MVLTVAPGSSVTHGNNFKRAKQNFYCNRIVDAWNSLPNTVVYVLSIKSFKRKLREVNLDRFLTIVE